MSVRAVVFDYGGVLARSPVPDDFRPIADEVGLTWEMYRAGFAKYRLAYDSDLMSCSDMYRRIASDQGIALSEDRCERLCEADDRSWLHPMQETLVWMKELKADGYRIGVLTNMATRFFDRFVAHVFAEHFAISDALVVSGKEGVSKPDARIYRIMEERIGVSPDEILFFDDNIRNVQGALSCGWNAEVFTAVDKARTSFRRLVQVGRKSSAEPNSCIPVLNFTLNFLRRSINVR